MENRAEAVHHGGERRPRAGLDEKGKEAARAGEVARKNRVVRVAGQGGVDDGAHPPAGFRAIAPFRSNAAQCSFIRTPSVRRPRATRKASSPATLRPRSRRVLATPGQASLVAETVPASASEWPTNILVRGVDHDVGAERQRLVVKRRRPAVVDQYADAAWFCRGCDGGQVLHLESQRAGTFHPDGPGVLGDQVGDAAADPRIVIADRHAHAPEEAVAETAPGIVDRVGEKDIVAGVDGAEHRQGDRRQPGGDHRRVVRAFERGDDRLDAPGRGVAVPAVEVRLLLRIEVGERLEQHRRAPIDGRIDEAELCIGVTSIMR